MNQQTRPETFNQRHTIAEIAEKAGVSAPTVSRVLNHRPDVATETRKRVERVMKENGFVRSNVASVLRKGRSGIIDIVTPDLVDPYSIEIVRGIEEALERSELRGALSTTHRDVLLERKWLTKVINGATDGAILVLTQGQSSHLDELRQHNIPFVVVDHRGELGIRVPSVGATNWLGGRMATEYVLSLGHRRIAMIGGSSMLRCNLDRVAGYKFALEKAGVPFDPVLIRPGDFTMQAGYEQTQALLSLPEPPTAIFAGCDTQAVGVYNALHACGKTVPEAMSVVGFDDVPFASIVSPPLTTIRQPLVEMGRMAASMLLHIIAGEPLDSMRVELATSLVERASCRPIGV